MAKYKKGKNEEEGFTKLRLPRKNNFEQFAIVTKMHGTNQLKAACEDGLERMCRITGKMKKRVWIREGDAVVIKVWDFQPSKADVVWRYIAGQKNYLARKGFLKNLPVEGE